MDSGHVISNLLSPYLGIKPFVAYRFGYLTISKPIRNYTFSELSKSVKHGNALIFHEDQCYFLSQENGKIYSIDTTVAQYQNTIKKDQSKYREDYTLEPSFDEVREIFSKLNLPAPAPCENIENKTSVVIRIAYIDDQNRCCALGLVYNKQNSAQKMVVLAKDTDKMFQTEYSVLSTENPFEQQTTNDVRFSELESSTTPMSSQNSELIKNINHKKLACFVNALLHNDGELFQSANIIGLFLSFAIKENFTIDERSQFINLFPESNQATLALLKNSVLKLLADCTDITVVKMLTSDQLQLLIAKKGLLYKLFLEIVSQSKKLEQGIVEQKIKEAINTAEAIEALETLKKQIGTLNKKDPFKVLAQELLPVAHTIRMKSHDLLAFTETIKNFQDIFSPKSSVETRLAKASHCVRYGQSIGANSNLSEMRRFLGITLMALGIALILASAAILVTTYGLGSPIALFGLELGLAAIITGATMGVAGGALGVTFFKKRKPAELQFKETTDKISDIINKDNSSPNTNNILPN